MVCFEKTGSYVYRKLVEALLQRLQRLEMIWTIECAMNGALEFEGF